MSNVYYDFEGKRYFTIPDGDEATLEQIKEYWKERMESEGNL